VTASLSDRTTATRGAYSTGGSRTETARAQAYRINNPNTDIRWLDGELFNGRRTQWMVVLAPSFNDRAPYRLDPDDVARVLTGRATVAAITRPWLNHVLTRELGRELAVPVGGLRFFRTGLVLHDDPAMHPAVSSADSALESLAAFRAVAAEAMSPANDPVERLRKLQAELVVARRQLRQRAASSPGNPDSPAFPSLFRDPTEQFTHDLYGMWLQLTAANEADRETYPLVYDLGPQFVRSVTEIVRDGQVSRERVLRICALVASGQANKVKETHRMHCNDLNTARVRAEDGAVAYRCPVQIGTPSSARLSYWLQDGGVPELSLLGRHDDIKIV
jgi:hypothetical protein